jgi:pimeloyl-ACP methyl ester carboxylesterase
VGVITGASPPSFLDRAVARTSATADVGLRTMAASIVGATIAPFVLSGKALEFEVEQLAFYESIALGGDATKAFVAPVGGVEMRARRVRPPGWIGDRGRVELLDFDSPFVALNPEARQEYASHEHNRVARSQHWRHADRPRPTIVVLHGFMASPYLVNAAFFSLPWFFAQGYDVLLVTLPFHGRRRAPLSPYSGHGFFAHGLAHLNEAVLQAVHDIRVYVRHLLDEQGAPAVGVTGLSLGGYTTAAVAAAEPRIHFAIPNAAVTEMGSLIQQWWPAGALAAKGLKSKGMGFDDLARLFAVHSPLTYPAAIAPDRLFVIGGLGDRLAPPEQSERLWEHWGRCKLHWYPGNHVVHVRRGDYLREMGRFLNATGFHEGLD